MQQLNHSSEPKTTIVLSQCAIFTTMVEYGDRLVQIMQERGVTASDLARHLKVTYQAVKKVMDGKSAAFNAVNHAIVAKYLGVSSDWLALGEGNRERKEGYWPLPGIDPHEFGLLSEEDKAEISAIVKVKLDRLASSPSKKSA